ACLKVKRKLYWEGLLLLIFTLSFTGLSREGLITGAVGLYAFFSTWFVKERNILFFLKGEMFLLATLQYRILLFAYSSPEAALERGFWGGFLFFLLIFCFFLYGAVIFLHDSRPFRERKGEAVFIGGGTVLLILFSLILGAEGVSHSIIPETANDPLRPRPELMDLSGLSDLEGGNLRGEGSGDRAQQAGESSGEGQEGEEGEPRLLGIPGDSWQNSSSSGEGEEPRQYAVMVVESPLKSTYMASRYFTEHEREAGFKENPENYLNEIARMRFVETWKNPHSPSYTGRKAVPLSALSVESEKGVPYFPYTVEPTVNDRSYYPFIYSWQSLSLVSDENRLSSLYSVRSYPDELPHEVEEALELDLPESMTALLDSLLDSLELDGMGPYEKLQAILALYGSYHYTLGFTEDWSTDHIMDFLVSSREGDCTEFSNGTALLARRAGIPTRVVTGYLASEGLQTTNHRQALLYLRDQIPPLQEKNLSQLYLVTSSHRHAWVQCWFPRFGWIDMETTAQAIAPSGFGDPNKLDVVIPIITETVQGRSRFIFPWRIVMRILLGGGILLLFIAYFTKVLYKAFLRSKGRRPGEEGYKSLYRLMLIRWIDRGHPPREKQMTPREYGEICPDLKEFSEAFISGLYGMGSEDEPKKWTPYREAYGRIWQKDRSLLRGLREIVSLKGLYYGIQSR
ncbi:MAG: transglutaminase domain-containing protein, partial [Spirochaetales bacterium]|nr:transglutaminase domain-containing protein [Spirochaetales bacterium]